MMTASELTYFMGAHFAHIVAYEEHLKLQRLARYKANIR